MPCDSHAGSEGGREGARQGDRETGRQGDREAGKSNRSSSPAANRSRALAVNQAPPSKEKSSLAEGPTSQVWTSCPFLMIIIIIIVIIIITTLNNTSNNNNTNNNNNNDNNDNNNNNNNRNNFSPLDSRQRPPVSVAAASPAHAPLRCSPARGRAARTVCVVNHWFYCLMLVC